MSTTDSRDAGTDYHYDLVVCGGGPAGCSAGVFCARYGLDTMIFDRGRSSIKRCAYLGNYLGFPAGIDVETFYELIQDHAEEAGCVIRPDLVESIERADGNRDEDDDDEGGGFVVTPQEGAPVSARRVIAVARYDGTYLRPLDRGDGDDGGSTGMFEKIEYDGEEREVFDREYADRNGKTLIRGLYVASPSAETDRQAIVAAGRGARVGLAVLTAVRREAGYPEAIVDRYDWMRKGSELTDEHAARECYRERFDEGVPDDHDPTETRLADLREAEIDRRLASYLDREAIDARTAAGQRAILRRLDDERVLERAREIEAERESSEARG
ncbi:thioredoxin reductase [Halobacteriales archaeon QS_3_64_16]|nr:MAG: thioredoxin reductase [Halobacteriales archaeon QS_3_64_16]